MILKMNNFSRIISLLKKQSSVFTTILKFVETNLSKTVCS